MTSAAADFEYSKDWLVTDSHRLSYYHVLGAPAGAVYIPFLRVFQYLFQIILLLLNEV